MAQSNSIPPVFGDTDIPRLNRGDLERVAHMEFMSGAAEGYIQGLLESYEQAYGIEQARALEFVFNQAKWAIGWKAFGRLALEVLG